MISGFHDSFRFSDVQGPPPWPKGCMSLARVVQRRSAHDNLDSSHGSPLPRFVVLAVQSYQEACGSCSAGTTTNSIRRSGLATMAQAPSMKDSCAMAQVQVQLPREFGIYQDTPVSFPIQLRRCLVTLRSSCKGRLSGPCLLTNPLPINSMRLLPSIVHRSYGIR